MQQKRSQHPSRGHEATTAVEAAPGAVGVGWLLGPIFSRGDLGGQTQKPTARKRRGALRARLRHHRRSIYDAHLRLRAYPLWSEM